MDKTRKMEQKAIYQVSIKFWQSRYLNYITIIITSDMIFAKLCFLFSGNATPPCLKHLDVQAAYQNTRAQLFNRRKSQHRRLKTCLVEMLL